MTANILIAINETKQEQRISSLLKPLFPDSVIECLSQLDIRNSFEHYDYALIWKVKPELFSKLAHLRFLQSFGAGIDFIPAEVIKANRVPICRFVDPDLTLQMVQYIVAQVLRDKLNFDDYSRAQLACDWQPKLPLAGDKVVILGFGALGKAAATQLIDFGFELFAFSQTAKQLPGVSEVHVYDQLCDLLPEADYVINLLPLTEQTKNFIDLPLLKYFKSTACFINAGRGGSVNNDALLLQLNNNKLRKAVLDVFYSEPLDKNNPLWTHEKVIITPHIASQTSEEKVVQLFVQNIERYLQKRPLLNVVDPLKGY